MEQKELTTRDEVGPPEDITILAGGGALAHISSAEVSVQVATAKKYPRTIARFMAEATEWVTLDEETAASMYYVIPRGGKKIEGPSIRLAEVAVSAWGHMHWGARPIEEAEKTVTVQGIAWDMERNNRVAIEVSRRITDRYGRRYDDDMVGVTRSAATSIAMRNAAFYVIPRVLIRRLYLAARDAAVGKGLTIEQQRDKALEAFAKMGVDEARVLGALNLKTREDLTRDHIADLRGMFTAIKDGEATIEEVFPKPGTSTDPPRTLKDLIERAAGTTVKSPPVLGAEQTAATIAGEVTPTRADAGVPQAQREAIGVGEPAHSPAISQNDPRSRAELRQAVEAEIKVRQLKKPLVEFLFRKYAGTQVIEDVTEAGFRAVLAEIIKIAKPGRKED